MGNTYAYGILVSVPSFWIARFEAFGKLCHWAPRIESLNAEKNSAVLLGVVTAFVLVAVIQKLGHSVYPPPADLSLAEPERWKTYVAGLPPGPFFFVLAAWALGTLGGGWVATRIAREKPLVYALIVGAVVMIASIAQLVAIPHPLWFTIAAMILIPAAAYAAARLAPAPA